MSDTVSENAKFNVPNKHDKKTGTTEIKHVLVDDYIDKSIVPLEHDMDIFEAAKMLLKKGISGIPVVDEGKKLLGFLSEKDILKHAYASKYQSMPPGTVKDYMTTELITVESGSEIFDVLELFIKNPFQIYPVIHEGKFIGVIQRTMALKAVCELKDKVW